MFRLLFIAFPAVSFIVFFTRHYFKIKANGAFSQKGFILEIILGRAICNGNELDFNLKPQ